MKDEFKLRTRPLAQARYNLYRKSKIWERNPINKRGFKTKSKKMSEAQAKRAVGSVGMSYPATKHNREQIAKALDNYLNKLRRKARKK